MKARKSVLLVATILCSVVPLCAMDDVATDETADAVEMSVAMPEEKGMAAAEENGGVAEQLSQAPEVKKPATTTPMAEVVMEEETAAPADVAVEAEEVSMNGDNNADVRGVFEEMSREEAGDETADGADHLG